MSSEVSSNDKLIAKRRLGSLESLALATGYLGSIGGFAVAPSLKIGALALNSGLGGPIDAQLISNVPDEALGLASSVVSYFGAKKVFRGIVS